MDMDQILNNIYQLPADSLSAIKHHIEEVTHPKGHLLIRANKQSDHIYFIKKGIARAYATVNNNEVTFWFGNEGDSLISMKSYVEGKEGYENIELLEVCQLYRIGTKELVALFDKDIHIANWARKFAERELIKTEERLISLQFKTATERYQELLKNSAGLLQRVPLGIIASYLGITQVSLSRIRAEIR